MSQRQKWMLVGMNPLIPVRQVQIIYYCKIRYLIKNRVDNFRLLSFINTKTA
ncbi:hypothetical protein GCM10027299_46360 [Larkinella ripae]